MNITYDLDYPPSLYPENVQNLLKMIGGAIAERLLIFKDEIDKEEQKEKCCIVIHFSDIKSDFWIGYVGYSESLKMKMKSSLDEDYMQYILDSIKSI